MLSRRGVLDAMIGSGAAPVTPCRRSLEEPHDWK